MLLIDGVRYELWVPKKEEEEFEPLVTDHIFEIFGEQSAFINIKQKMKTKSGIGSIPDGYVIVIDKIPSWHVIEIELSCHPLYDHIVTQMSKFNNGIKNHSTQKDMVDMFYNYIDGEEFLKIKIKKLIHPIELHKYLTDLVDKQPSVTVIIEQKTEALQEALSALPFATTVVEFKTYVREGVNNINVHAHIFEPLYKVSTTQNSHLIASVDTENQSASPIIIKLGLSHITYPYIHIPKNVENCFPPGDNNIIQFHTNIGIIKARTCVGCSNGKDYLDILKLKKEQKSGDIKDLKDWFEFNKNLKPGDKIQIDVVVPKSEFKLHTL